MKLTEQYAEIVGVTHRSGEEECHDVMPKVIQLEIAIGLAIEKMAYGDNHGASSVLRKALIGE